MLPCDVIPDILYHFRFEHYLLYNLYKDVKELRQYICISKHNKRGVVWHLYPRIQSWGTILA